MTEAEEKAYQHRLNATMFGGEASGFDAASAVLARKAGEAFSLRRDEVARALREIAEELAEAARRARANQAREQEREERAKEEEAA